MSRINDMIKLDLKDYLNRTRPTLDVSEVVAFEEDTKWSGGCETCSFEYIGMDICYRDSAKKLKNLEIDMSLSEFLNGLE